MIRHLGVAQAMKNKEILNRLETLKVYTNSSVNRNWSRMSNEIIDELSKLFKAYNVETPGELRWVLLNGERPRCELCGNITRFNRSDFFRFCSKKCSANAPSTDQTRKATNLKLYGTEKPQSRTEQIAAVKQTVLQRYGEQPPHYFGGKAHKAKMMELYGAENPAQVKSLNEQKSHRIHASFTERFLPELAKAGFTTEEKLLTTGPRYLFKCVKCSTEVEARVWCGKIPRCRVCWPYNYSTQHIKIRDWLISIGEQPIENDRTIIKPLEIDLYLPKRKLGFEINGLYWHSVEPGGNIYAHQQKTLTALKNGITLIHLYEDQINLNFTNVTSKILENYLAIDENEDILIKEILAVDGSWPLPQQFSAALVSFSKPRPYHVASDFRPKIKNQVWDSGILFYKNKD